MDMHERSFTTTWGVDETLVDDKIYNGADDNASGVSAVLQIARAFALSGEKPLRNVIFAFGTARKKDCSVQNISYSTARFSNR